MNRRHIEHILRMERIISHTRLGAVVVTAAAFVQSATALSDPWHLIPALWAFALLYAVTVAIAQPYRYLSLNAWEVVSGLIDWGLISLGIVLTGGTASDLYLLYFLSVLSVALRYGLREVLLAAGGTVAGYLAVLLLITPAGALSFPSVLLRMGYLMIFAVGSGLLARETTRQFRARVQEEAQRIAVQDLTAAVSHDLVNPLTAILGLVEMVTDSSPGSLSAEQLDLLHRVNANAQQMSGIVHNLLDVELIERGQQPFHPLPVEVNTLVQRIVEAQQHQAEVKHIGLVLDLGARLPVVPADERMVERLLANLVGNAVKFTPTHGAMRISTRRQESRLVIEVWNSGPRIPAEVETVMFEKFVRQSNSTGCGLGLYICRSIVEMHRGRISAHNTSDGVAFVVELPAESSTYDALPSPLAAMAMPLTS